VVPFVRVTRDKRGYEHIALMQGSSKRGRPAKPRTLYVFRTPPGVKLGREPFDQSVRCLIEEQNPGVVFDWKALSHIVPPPPDAEYWREKRRAEKAAKQARRAEERQDVSREPVADADGSPEDEGATALASQAEVAAEGVAESGDDAEPEDSPQPQVKEGVAAGGSPAPGQPEGQRRRRRRRGGRGRATHQTATAAANQPDPSKVTQDPSKE